jgi:hypothetical protein
VSNSGSLDGVAQHKIYKVRGGLVDMFTYALHFRVADVSAL